MAKKNTKAIVAALKKLGVELEDQDKVEVLLDDLELRADELLGTDQIILTKDEHRELKDDLTKLRGRAKAAEKDLENLQTDVDKGDSTNARQLGILKKRNDELEPLVKELVTAYTATWDGVAKDIPEKLKGKFKFAAKDGELETADLLHNIRKLEEYRELDLLPGGSGSTSNDDDDEGAADGEGSAVRTANKQAPGKKFTKQELENMTPAEKIETGYVYDSANRSSRD